MAQDDGASSPVDVVKLEPRDLPAAQAEIQGTAHDRVGTPHRTAGLAERGRQLLEFLCRDCRGQCRKPPIGGSRHRSDQTVNEIAERGAIAEIAVQRGHHRAGAAGLAVERGLLSAFDDQPRG